MKKSILLVVLTAFAFTFNGFAAQGEAKAKKAPMTVEQRADAMLQKLDKDGDAKLDKAELAAQPAHKPKAGAPVSDKPAPTPEERAAKMIERGDKDKDGKLDKAELVEVLKPAPKKKAK